LLIIIIIIITEEQTINTKVRNGVKSKASARVRTSWFKVA